jgi:hypothetical protein
VSAAPKVYSAISAVAAELGRTGIAKSQTNAQEQYQFRGIDDVYKRLSPALAANKLCILPRVLERVVAERTGAEGSLLISVSVRTAFDLVSAEDGSVHVIEAYGEALDGGDKATAKAMTAAFKCALFQAFCIPVSGTEDADATTHQLRVGEHVPEPVQGWGQWSNDISDVVAVCETGEALDRLQNINRALLKSVSRERPDLYTRLGATIRERRAAIAPVKSAPPVRAPSTRRKAAKSKVPPETKANGAGGVHAGA